VAQARVDGEPEVWTTANGVVQGDILDQRSTLSSRWRGAATVALL